MTGPEHYLKAEQLLATAVKIHNAAEKVSNENGGLLPEVHQGLMAEATLMATMAQVHATLAVEVARG